MGKFSLGFRKKKANKSTAPRIAMVIPAHNEEDVIADTIKSALAQTRKPDSIIVILDNCIDKTEKIVKQFPEVTAFRSVDNKLRKVGALSQAWQKYGNKFDLWFGVDADTILEKDCLKDLEDEILTNEKIGGVMARYTFDQNSAEGRGLIAKFLVRMQRFEFAGWINDILHRQRKTYVLGGQATLFRVEAMAEVAASNGRSSPWLESAVVEDMELTWQLEKYGWLALVSTTARAYVGPMYTFKTLWAQRRKWDSGTVEILRSYGFSSITSYPWKQQGKMLLDFVIRAGFFILLTTSLVLDAWIWFWVWIIPPVFAILLNLRIVWIIPNRKITDILFGIFLPIAEFYLMFRLAIWITSWVANLTGKDYDGWGNQYRAEGKYMPGIEGGNK